MNVRWAASLLCFVGALAGAQTASPQASPEPDRLDLWNGREIPEGDILELTYAGVVFEDAFGVQRTVRWDFVRDLTGPHAEEAEPFLRLAKLAWRARTRLERGDAVSAEPMFEELYPVYEGMSSEMSSMVSEGLLRCRLRRSAQTAAIRPWLAFLVSERAGPYHSRMVGTLRPACDEESGLVPSLAPVWLHTPAVEAFARSEPIVVWDQAGSIGPRRAEILETLYRHAARFECGLELGASGLDLTKSDVSDEGLRLVHAIVMARCGDVEERVAARKTLESIRDETLDEGSERAWIEAWCRLGIGRSLLREPDRESQRQGIIELLHLPARYGTSQPYLAGVALAESALALDALGDTAGASSLFAELRDRYSSHAVTNLDAVRSRLDSLNNSPTRRTGTIER